MTDPDSRLHAIHANPAMAVKMEIIVPVASMHREPGSTSMQTTQALYGEKVNVFENRNGWLWCQLERDQYVGYIHAESASKKLTTATHRVATPTTLMYALPDIKSQPVLILPLNAHVEVISENGGFANLSNGGFIYASHLKPVAQMESDFVQVAEQFVGAPYYWGGKTIHGLDCSGLVQTSLQACGVDALRDTDMQEKQLGQNLMINDLDGLRRGDLIFWKGHVGIMADDRTLLHANGHHMLTVKEPLVDAVQRITASGYHITSIKRF